MMNNEEILAVVDRCNNGYLFQQNMNGVERQAAIKAAKEGVLVKAKLLNAFGVLSIAYMTPDSARAFGKVSIA